MEEQTKSDSLSARATAARAWSRELLGTSRELIEQNHQLLDESYRLRRQRLRTLEERKTIQVARGAKAHVIG
ncbi:hypothetical protein [Streptomyces sp. NPDC059786]|uniref:hypothetical protein n=1 Tax=Streptomyces sp. NPDC059786 TaxID=3346946 RepID=UPI003648B5AC